MKLPKSFITSVLLIASAILASSCTGEEPADFVRPTQESALMLSQGLEVPASGGIYTLNFIHNPANTEVACDKAGNDGWIHLEQELRTPGLLTLFLKAAPNEDTDSREAMAHIKCGNAELYFEIRQKGNEVH